MHHGDDLVEHRTRETSFGTERWKLERPLARIQGARACMFSVQTVECDLAIGFLSFANFFHLNGVFTKIGVKWRKTPTRGNTPTSCFLATTP